jgi:hypothetical protein
LDDTGFLWCRRRASFSPVGVEEVQAILSVWPAAGKAAGTGYRRVQVMTSMIIVVKAMMIANCRAVVTG